MKKLWFTVKQIEINPAIAFSAFRNLVLTCGGIAIFSFVFSLRWFWIPFAAFGLAGLWAILYSFEYNYRARRLRDFRYE